MALSATFTANFASFYDAVDKADAKLKDFGAGADKVGGRLTAMANQFSGVKVIQEATLMAKAVEEIGGTSKLTEKELARLGATANEAVAKMTALGMDVPQNLQHIADETKDANKATTDWLGTISKMAGAIGVAFSVGAITNFIGSVFQAASAIQDLSDQWGVSTRAVQQWSNAAEQSGVTAESLGRSIQFFSENLSEGSAEYQALLANIGLSYDKLRKMPLEDAYKAVITALGTIKDGTLQLDVAQGILGKSAKEMAGAIRNGFLEAADAQDYMAEETIKRLKAAQAAWKDLKDAVVIHTGEMLATVQSGISKMTSSWGTFFKTIGQAFVDGPQAASVYVEGLDNVRTSLKNTAKDINLADEANKTMTGGIKTTAQALQDLHDKQEAQKKAEADRKAALEAAKKAEEEYAAAAQKHVDVVNDLLNQLTGQDLIGKANDYFGALLRAGPIEDLTAKQQEAINTAMADAIEVYAAAGKEAPQYMYDIWAATVKAEEATQEFTGSLGELLSTLTSAPPTSIIQNAINTGMAVALKPPPIPPGMFDGLAKSLSGSILRAIEGGGSVLAAAGSTIGNYLLDPKQSGLGKSIADGAAKLPSLLGSAISGALPVVGSLIGPAVSWLGSKIAGLFGKKEYEKLRDSFVQAAGGIAPLTQAAQEAGISLDNLLRARNTDQVKAAIGTIQEALESEKLRKAFVETEGGFDALVAAAETAGISVDALFAARTSDQVTKAIADIEDALKFQADAYQTAIDTAKKYGFTLEELGPAMQRQELDKMAQELYQDWQVLNSAGIDTVAITEHMAESVNAYVHDAKAMGAEVPEAMRPMLQAMVDSGQLLDENGNAITNLEDSGISFAMTMSDGFKKLIDQVEKLTDAISRSLGLAIKDIPQPKIVGKVSWDVDEVPKASASGGARPMESYQTGTDGFKNFGAGTPVMLHGWEAVVPRAESGAFDTVTGGVAAPAASDGATIVINAQGAFFDTPESLQRLATKVSDALTAKYSVTGRLRTAV